MAYISRRSDSSENDEVRKKEDGMLMVLVQWDNGTQSYFSPDGLERA